MALFKKLVNIFGATEKKPHAEYIVSVRCNRCGEIISTRVDLANDLSFTDDGYLTRKVLIGSGENRCFQRVEVVVHFDARHKVVDREISGGSFVD